MSVGILVCGAPPAPLVAAHGTYADMVDRMLGIAAPSARYDVTADEPPDDATAQDVWILTGSPAGVHDDLAWIAPLAAFLRRARGRAALVGLCFGHQAMAHAFGGRVARAPGGWGIGVHRYDVVHRAPWMDGAAWIEAPASHQDQVVVCPPGARVTLASAFTPYAALDYGDAISFQFHPEFTAAYGRALIDARRSVHGAAADAAIASYDDTADWGRVGDWIARFAGSTTASRIDATRSQP